jgi:hypothetical protein
MEDVMVRFSDDKIATEFMTQEQVKAVCPLAYAEAPTNKVSDKYVLANTGTVIADMEKLGWKVVSAKQRKAKTGKQSRFSFHMITFQNPDVKILGQDQDGNETVEGYPRIILTNSADGFNSFKFAAAMFRLVCSNGLVIATDKFADMSIRHINYNFEELRQLVSKVVTELPSQIEVVNDMKKQILTNEQKEELALNMLKLRKGLKPEDELTADKDTITEVLVPQRVADQGNNLWNVFNVLQERMIRGGYSTLNKKGKARKVRPIKGFIRDFSLNKSFFELALNYLNAIKQMEAEEPEVVDVEAEVSA